MEKLTQNMAKKYFEESGCVCPFCGSEEITGSNDVEFDSDYAFRVVSCDVCKQEWRHEYRLTAISKGEDDFENEELIKSLAKPKIPDYYSMAHIHANKNGLELVRIIFLYAICKKNENEWCVYLVTDNGLEDEDNGIDTEEGAIQTALLKIFVDDLSSSGMVKIDDNVVHFGFSNDTFHAEWEDDRGTYEVNLQFDCIDLIRNLGVGQWKITANNEEYVIKFFTLSPYGAEL